MYQNFFELRGNPFGTNPDPRYLYLTRDAQEALACLTYGIQARKGFIVLSGEVGTGKTTLLNKLLNWLRGDRAATAFVFNPSLTVGEFLDFMMADFGIACQSPMKSQVLLHLNRWLLERYRAGEAVVLIVDEAQNLSLEVLEEIRLLTNLETSSEKLIQIVLSGQPELDEKLKLPQLRQLRQRINLRAYLHPLTLEEARGYIAERLRIAGGDGREIFAPEAIERVHFCSNGIPRLFNLLCEHALISAFADQDRIVTAERIEQTAGELELDQKNAVTLGPVGEPEPTVQEKELLRSLAIAVRQIRKGN
ncbi:MAG TPA: AAA family ATPase [Patescibacteria group bacterium]|nr:AAA family ATPase [Patescibacteria group bacterium]